MSTTKIFGAGWAAADRGRQARAARAREYNDLIGFPVKAKG
jgi:hypothetical protein